MVKMEQKIQCETRKEILSPKSVLSLSSSSPSSSCKKNKKYKGVRMRSWGSWVSEIRAPNQKTRIWLGSYTTPEAAARAYDAALLCLKGSSANLNFPDITSSISIPSTDVLSPKSIQRVAAAAAAAASSVPPDTPSSESLSSPIASSPSDCQDQHDDDVVASMMDSLGSFSEKVSWMEPSWYNGFDGIQSPKHVTDDQLMFDGISQYTMPVFDDLYEEGDIRLWSFC